MKTVLELIRRAGGWHPGLYLKIDNPPYMGLVIEALGETGPCGVPAISVAHYGELNGDAMRDPEVCFEFSQPPLCAPALSAYYYRNDYAGIEQWSRFLREGQYAFHAMLHLEHERFAALWDKNLNAQRFLEAFTDRSICG